MIIGCTLRADTTNVTTLLRYQPEAEKVLLELIRKAPTWRKVEMLGQLHRVTRDLVISELRSRYPHASSRELQRRLADLMLGPTLAARA